MRWENLEFIPYFEGSDNFVEKYRDFSAQLMVNLKTGHMRFDPMPESNLLDEFYSNSFTRSESDPTPESEFTENVISIAAGVIGHIKSIDPLEVLPEQWRVFDIGCGFGGFVWAMQQNGMQAWGNELNPDWVKNANLLCDGNLFFGQFDEVQSLINEKYDFIFISHTLEHLPDPVAVLRQAKRYLAENGLIYVNVPNSRSNRFRKRGRRSGIDYGNFPMHLNFFTPSSMSYLTNESGLKLVQLRTRPLDELEPLAHSDDVERFDDLYLGGELFALLAHNSNDKFLVDSNIEKKIRNSSKSIPHSYMTSHSSTVNKFKVALRKLIS